MLTKAWPQTSECGDVGQWSSPYLRNDIGLKAKVISNTLKICACMRVCVRCVGMCIHCLYLCLCRSVLDVSKALKVMVLIGIRSVILIENWRLKSKHCWQYSIYQLNLSVFVMHSPVISGFFLNVKEKLSVNVMNRVCGTSLQIALRAVTEIWQ